MRIFLDGSKKKRKIQGSGEKKAVKSNAHQIVVFLSFFFQIADHPTGIPDRVPMATQYDDVYTDSVFRIMISLWMATVPSTRKHFFSFPMSAKTAQFISITSTPCLSPRCNDTLAERLRRRPAKPMGSPRVGSNPTGVDICPTTGEVRIARLTICLRAVILNISGPNFIIASLILVARIE